MSKFKNATPIRNIVQRAAEKNGVDPVMLSAVTEAYYDSLGKAISELKHPQLILIGFGKLKLSRSKLDKSIKAIENFLKQPEEKSLAYIIKKKYFNQSRLLKLKKGLQRLNECDERLKKEYQDRLEKQKANSGGNSE